MFEVETTPAASLSNNAMKVLGEHSSVLLKPLFFFHLVIKGGKKSSRIEITEKTFHSHNYGIYLLKKGDALDFLKEVLSQHRRLTNQLNIINVIRLLMADWNSINLSEFLQHVEALKFPINYLEAYALLAQELTTCKGAFFRYLQEAEKTHFTFGCAYSRTYLGSEWSTPIHLALLAYRNPFLSENYVDEIKGWQEKSSYVSQIGPNWGLSYDYDEFIARQSPFLWALIANLLSLSFKAQRYICEQMIAVLRTMLRAHNYVGFFHAVWLLHISSVCGHNEGFEFASGWINDRGGIGEKSLSMPPAIIFYDDPDADWIFAGAIIQVSSISAFRSILEKYWKDSATAFGDAADLTLNVLTRLPDQSQADALVRQLHKYPFK